MQETVPKSEISAPNQPVEQVLENVDEQPPTREITQTDRINKNLLSSFLGRINNDSEFQQRFMEENSTSDNDSFDDE